MWAAEACEGCVTITLFTYQATPCRCSLFVASDHYFVKIAHKLRRWLLHLTGDCPGRRIPTCCARKRGNAKKVLSERGFPRHCHILITCTQRKTFLFTDSLQDQLVNSAHSLTQLLTTRRVLTGSCVRN